MYGCETWSLTLRKERKFRVFENMVLRRIFGPTRDEVTEEWRRLHNEELNDLYSSPNRVRVTKSRRMRWAGHVDRMGEERGCIGSCWENRREGVVSVLQASACNTDTTPTQPHRNSNTHRTNKNTTNVVIQQNSRKLLMMDILMSETC